MCTSIADGGRRCFSHEKLDSTTNLKKRMKKAQNEQDAEGFKNARNDYLTTEEGIEKLESEEKFEIAEKFRARRNKLIDQYNRETGASMAHFASYSSRRRRAGTSSQPLWSKTGKHRVTKTIYSPKGFTQSGVHKNGTFYDDEGFDAHGYDQQKFNRDGFDSQGYGRDGFHHSTKLDRQGYGKSGFNRSGYNRGGFYLDGFHRETAIHEATGTRFNPEGVDAENYGTDGFHIETGLDRESYDRNGYNYWHGTNRNGVDRIQPKQAGSNRV